MSLKTALYENHVKQNGTIVDFADYLMPVQYKDGIIEEHKWTRKECGIFDVSHMGQIILSGSDVASVLSYLTPADFTSLKIGTCKYTLLMNENGGIIDDLIITKFAEDKFFLVLNASRKHIDLATISKYATGKDVDIINMFDLKSLIAVQGPKTLLILQDIFAIRAHEIANIKYMTYIEFHDSKYGNIILTRTGYTGEFGFEISIDNGSAAIIWEVLSQYETVKPIGLGARDSLRLEAGYPLYGNDIDENTTIVEADLSWTVSKKNQSFRSYDTYIAQSQGGASKHRVGLKLIDAGILRHGYEIFDDKDDQIGIVTSGGYSPTLGLSIGMGYVPSSFKISDVVYIKIRNKNVKAEIITFPAIELHAK